MNSGSLPQKDVLKMFGGNIALYLWDLLQRVLLIFRCLVGIEYALWSPLIKIIVKIYSTFAILRQLRLIYWQERRSYRGF